MCKLAVLLSLAMTPGFSEPTSQADAVLPENLCVLEVESERDIRVTLAGKTYGPKKFFRFEREFDPREVYRSRLIITAASKTVYDRPLVLVGGWRYRVALPVKTLAHAKKTWQHEILGSVVDITDGDTVIVADDQRRLHKIRLDGIDGPESTQAYGDEARRALEKKILQKRVSVLWNERGKYGRIIGRIFVGKTDISRQMVEEGWAWHYRDYSDDESLAAAEKSARKNRAGLWAGKAPIPPWDFRHKPEVSEEVTVAKPVPPVAKPAPPVRQQVGVQVYVTRTGEKYHLRGCRYLRKSMIPIDLESARRFHGPCSVCRPPR